MRKLSSDKTYLVPLFILVAFIIAATFFVTLYFLANSQIDGWHITLSKEAAYTIEKNFYSNLDPSEKKGFLVGTSQIQALNSTYIQQILAVHDKNFKIYNLSIPSDIPTKRLTTINMLISSHPNFVVYEISDIDFMNDQAPDSLFNETNIVPVLPSPELTLHSFLVNTFLRYHIEMPLSPKYQFLSFIGDYIGEPSPLHIPVDTNSPRNPNLPLSNIPLGDIQSIASDDKLRTLKGHEDFYDLNDLNPAPINENALAAVEIIKKLQESHIRVIVFIAPSQRYHIEDMGNNRIDQFNSIVSYISEQTGIHIYSLYDKYQDLPIFEDLIHVAINKKSIIYSQDVAKIILAEIQ